MSPLPWREDKYERLLDDSGEIVQISGVSQPCGCVPENHIGHKNRRFIISAINALQTIGCLRKYGDYCSDTHPCLVCKTLGGE